MNKNQLILFIFVLIVSIVTSKLIKSPYTIYSNNYKDRVKLNVDDPPPSPNKLIWYQQTLDHFNFETKGTFQQRVLISDTYWKQPTNVCSTPIIFFCGNEGDIDFFYENSLFVTNTLAQELSALIIFAEHRYYGESLPFGNSSYTNENLQYLSIEQALSDFVMIIQHFTAQYNATNCPVFTTSGSYGGDLAAFMRLKYPNIVDGALAASAPLLYYIGTGVPYDTYAISNTKNFAETSSEGSCAQKIKSSFLEIQQMATQDNGFDQISNTFKLCSPITNETDFENLLDWFETAFNYLGMADYPYPTSFLMPLPGNPVNYTCDLISKAETSVDVMLAAIGVYFNYTGEMKQCFDTNVFTNDESILIPWGYQSCTQVVTPFSVTGVNDMYFDQRFNLDEYILNCQESFGVTPDPNWITTFYGGSEIFPSSNIIFSNGVLDPWHNGGINVTQTSQNIIALLIPGAAHHLDLRYPNAADPQSVTNARAYEIKILSQWSIDASLKKSI